MSNEWFFLQRQRRKKEQRNKTLNKDANPIVKDKQHKEQSEE